ncbi:MAG: phosphatidylglycerophosphatase A, partial [Phycisphaerae bacterium]|nr:phosphatidylglycerophosphatase A [Phycisphaerae bacterium]
MPPLVRLLVTVGGLGLMRPASGTWGSLPPALIAALFVLTGVSAWAWVAVMGGLVAVFSLACVAGGDWAEADFGKKDPGEVVADETAGMALTLLTFAGLGQGESMTIGRGLMVVAVAFVAFRVMD